MVSSFTRAPSIDARVARRVGRIFPMYARQGYLDGWAFARWMRDAGVVDSRFTAEDVDIVFAACKPASKRRVDIATFGQALFAVSEKKGITVQEVVAMVANVRVSVSCASVSQRADVAGPERFFYDQASYTGTHRFRGPYVHNVAMWSGGGIRRSVHGGRQQKEAKHECRRSASDSQLPSVVKLNQVRCIGRDPINLAPRRLETLEATFEQRNGGEEFVVTNTTSVHLPLSWFARVAMASTALSPWPRLVSSLFLRTMSLTKTVTTREATSNHGGEHLGSTSVDRMQCSAFSPRLARAGPRVHTQSAERIMCQNGMDVDPQQLPPSSLVWDVRSVRRSQAPENEISTYPVSLPSTPRSCQ
eukprot:TRINITY_DN57829_c0_g1_i1.p1 TRINITY_DN57829_c0_g1~~TRINITY_DN57829_c0_g1_i1.p1  ORF type:complete len:360 (+),score=29.34 TRINITY_DN57829_c0_g1_i1:72-1151(+)